MSCLTAKFCRSFVVIELLIADEPLIVLIVLLFAEVLLFAVMHTP